MSKPFPHNALCCRWRSFHTDELQGWSVEYSPFMDVEGFSILTPDRREYVITHLDTIRGLHAMLGEVIQKAEEIEHARTLAQNERK